MSRAVLFVYAAVLYTFIVLGFIMACWLLGEKVKRHRAATKVQRDLKALRDGWTTDDDRKAAALLRDDW